MKRVSNKNGNLQEGGSEKEIWDGKLDFSIFLAELTEFFWINR